MILYVRGRVLREYNGLPEHITGIFVSWLAKYLWRFDLVEQDISAFVFRVNDARELPNKGYFFVERLCLDEGL